MIAVADSQKPAERHDGVDHPSRELVDHQAVDRAQFLALTAVYGSSLDLVRRNQISGLLGRDSITSLRCHDGLLIVVRRKSQYCVPALCAITAMAKYGSGMIWRPL